MGPHQRAKLIITALGRRLCAHGHDQELLEVLAEIDPATAERYLDALAVPANVAATILQFGISPPLSVLSELVLGNQPAVIGTLKDATADGIDLTGEEWRA